ncbi:MAG: type II secretion system protein GspE [Myxococcales bacterium]|nr:MAG: type II secretion system protein GspE [Myxococcales bacterium]
MRLGEILIQQQSCKPEDVAQALETQADRETRLGDIMLLMKRINEEQLANALAFQLGLDYLKEIPRDTDFSLVQGIPINYAKQYKFVPIKRHNGSIVVATSEPLELFALDDLQLLFGGRLDIKVASQQRVLNAINHIYSEAGRDSANLDDERLQSGGSEEDATIDLMEVTDDDAPIIQFVNNVLFRAVKERASDIHIEPMEKDLVVRFRIDGVLYEIARPPKAAQASISSRVKIMGNLNIAEKRLPQDGRIRLKVAGKDIDIRLSTLPTSHGERIVMRLLDRSDVLLDLKQLGFLAHQYAIFEKLIHQTHGILLVTGPTGSGKTTTLYSALSKINRPDVNIITIEDPVEYQLPGVGQIPVNAKIGMTFASGLRSILRQDPDIIMIGEIRDVETAEIAIQSSLTGHLVFSTVHTNDAPSTVTRLIDMGVEPYLVASSVIGILAQRLVRLVCQHCREPYEPNDEELGNIGLDRREVTGPFYRAVGCPHCLNLGYSGRKGIYELLVVEEEMQTLIQRNAPLTEMRRAALTRGMHTLRMDGVEKIKQGWTTTEEVIRVTQDQILTD